MCVNIILMVVGEGRKVGKKEMACNKMKTILCVFDHSKTQGIWPVTGHIFILKTLKESRPMNY